nr:hypothetical protein [Tanacetum cinerariifolium]
MPYPRFTKVIINHFISKDNTISIRNQINLHTIRDDILLDTLKFVSKTKDCQKYGALIPNGMINQNVKDSKTYMTYYNFSTGKGEPKKKGKHVKRSAKKTSTTSIDGVVIIDTLDVSISKKKGPAKADRGKGIELLSDAALLEKTHMKKAIKKSRRETHKLQVSGSNEGSDFESEGDSEEKSDDDNDKNENDDDNEEDDSDNDDGDNDDGDNDDVGNDDEGNDDEGSNEDSDQTDSDDDENSFFTLKDYEEEEQYKEFVLTLERNKSDDDNEIYKEEDDDVAKEVSVLETKVSEFNQTSQFAETVSLISSIVDNYLASKLKEEVNEASWLQSNKLKEEAKAENQEFINQVDSTMKKIIKEQVKAQISKIIPQIEDYVTESLEAKVLYKSSSKSTQAEEPEFEATDIEIHHDQGNESGHIDDQPDNKDGPKHDYKTLPLIEDQGRQVVPTDYFINNDLEYLKGGSSSRKYATSTTRTKAAKYDNIKGIEDMVPTL